MTTRPESQHTHNGITYRARGGMIKAIKTPRGWINVWNSGGVSAPVRAILNNLSPQEVYQITCEKGSKI